MMLQVLVIDDEPLVHHDLSTLMDWRERGFELCGQAYSGANALELIELSPPHIAIIDVNMPDMNGVELNTTIQSRFPAVKTIMLSSYDDYDYVRECLNHGAVDYLLKHRLDGATLTDVLNKAAQRLRQDGEQASQADRGNSEESMHPMLIRDLITDAVRGNKEAVDQLGQYSASGALYSGAVRYGAAVAQIIPFRLYTESYSDVQRNRLVQQALEIMQQSLGDIHRRTAAYMGDGRFIVLFSFMERSEHAASSEASRLMSKLQHSLELFLNLKCGYSIGHIFGSLPKLGESYASAERALDRTEGSGSDSSSEHRQERASLTIEEQKRLLLSIERMDGEGIHQLIADVFAPLRNQPAHSHAVQAIVSEFLQIGDKSLKKWMPALSANDAKGGEGLSAQLDIGKLGSIRDIEQWLQSYYDGLLKSLMQQRVKGNYSRHVSQAIQIILERYQEDLTLQAAAGEIQLNPSYLSRIFKEETHTTFSEYLNRVRIDAGRRLLESGQYSIKEISGRVGFATYNYFFKVFKELTGMTPHTYVNSSQDRNSATVKLLE